MKGLRKYLTPFAPDQSGAASVLYDLGGILVICDAGGCAGNICGFDEPRWSTVKSAVFSAGLRDMDAILGRDDRLVEKLGAAAEEIDANFAAIIGTPVPAVIGTDFQALGRMAKKKTGLPILSLPCYGMKLSDAGEEMAYDALFRTLTEDIGEPDPGRIGVLGAATLELGDLSEAEGIRDALLKEGWQTVSLYGMGASFREVQTAGQAKRNLVVAPSGLKAAKYLQSRFGTPYEVRYPVEDPRVAAMDLTGKRVLAVHQQVRANSLREQLRGRGAETVHAASWFMMEDAWMEPGDVHLAEEDEFEALVRQGEYDVILADDTLRLMCGDFRGLWLPLPHFAISGKQVVA